jgi:hypothetical protein
LVIAHLESMIPKSMPSGFDPMGGCRLSVKIMPQANNLERDPIQLNSITVQSTDITACNVLRVIWS